MAEKKQKRIIEGHVNVRISVAKNIRNVEGKPTNGEQHNHPNQHFVKAPLSFQIRFFAFGGTSADHRPLLQTNRNASVTKTDDKQRETPLQDHDDPTENPTHVLVIPVLKTNVIVAVFSIPILHVNDVGNN